MRRSERKTVKEKTARNSIRKAYRDGKRELVGYFGERERERESEVADFRNFGDLSRYFVRVRAFFYGLSLSSCRPPFFSFFFSWSIKIRL